MNEKVKKEGKKILVDSMDDAGVKTDAGVFSMDSLRSLLEFSPALREVLGAKLDIKDGLQYREVVQRVSDLLPAIIREAEGEDAAKLEEYKNQIEKFFQTEKPETIVDQETVSRTIRDIGFAESVDSFAADKEVNAPMLAGVLERQNWGKILNNLKKGDRVLSFLVPGADFLSIKYLNDNVFGPQITNEIIAQKRLVLERKIQEIDKNAALLQSDYKTEIIKIPESVNIGETTLVDIAKAVDAEMTDFVLDTANRLLRHEKNADKIAALRKFKNDLQGRKEVDKSGFRMNYGLATVGGDEVKDQLLALDHSLQTSRLAREEKDKDIYGAEYSESKTMEELGDIKDLRESIIGLGNSIEDEDGNRFDIFIKSEEGSKQIINRDLLRDVRKNKFKTTDKDLMNKVVLYVKKLNILDVVKPFVYEEAEDVGKNIERFHQLAEKIKNEELSDSERKEVERAFRSDEKAPEYTSKSEFHKRATSMEDAVYVSMDVLDLGVDLLLEYESALQDIENTPDDKKLEKFNEVSLSAGDKTTDKLRKFRAEVVRVYKEFGLGDDLVVGEVGGDELTLAIDTKDLMEGVSSEKTKEERLNELLFALKKATNTRVIKTVVSESEKHVSNQSSQRSQVEAHLKAMKRAEVGASIAKDLEEVARKLTRLLARQGEVVTQEKIDGLNEIFIIEGKEIKSNFVVMESGGEFKIANSNKTELDYKKVKKDLDTFLGK